MNEPITKAGRWLIDRSRWDDGMRGFFVRINATGGPDDMHRHVLTIEDEAAQAALAAHDCFWDGQPARPEREPQDVESLRMDVTDEEADAFLTAIEGPPKTDWKAVADEMYMYAVGLSVGGRTDPEAEKAAARARVVYDGCIKANTKETP